MLVSTAGFLPGGRSARLMIVIAQGMKGDCLEGRGCKQRLSRKHCAQIIGQRSGKAGR